jgi:hypothetical protein
VRLSHRGRLNGLPGRGAKDVVAHVACGLVAVVRVLGHRLEDDGIQSG